MTTKIVTTEEMRRLESEADAAGITYADMMEHAGRAVADAVLARIVPVETTALVLVGPGNNGGDGLVAARHLHEAGVAVKVFSLKPLDESDSKVVALRERSVFIVDFEDDPSTVLRQAQDASSGEALQSRALKHLVGSATVIVDAVFGTGARLPLKDNTAQMMDLAKRHVAAKPKPPLVVAVDCPSGTNCDTGEIDPAALRADVTVTFGAAKAGQFKFPAADFLGELIIAPIGWPDDLPGLKAINLELADADRISLPERKRDAHKYTFGKVLVVAGSKKYVGAAYLAGAAAYRCGAGLVTLAVPDPIYPILAAQLPEATWEPLPSESGFISASAVEVVRTAMDKADALILGPGWGTAETTLNFLRALLTTWERPERQSKDAPATVADAIRSYANLNVLVDADGLRLLAQIEGWPDLLPKPAVLTPHPGEMAALTWLDKEEIQKDRVGIARKFAARWGHIVLLKGAFTVVAAPDGRAVLEPFATPALAKAGSGDVLSGIIGGLLAQGLAPFEAAVAGAFIHGKTAEAATGLHGNTTSIIAGDLIAALPKVMAELST